MAKRKKKLPGFTSEIKGARKIGWRDRVPKGWYIVKAGTYYNHIKPL